MVHDSIAELERTGRELQEECRATVTKSRSFDWYLLWAYTLTAPPPDSVALIPAASSVWLTSAASSTGVVFAAIAMGQCGLPVRRGHCRCRKYASVTSLGRRASSVSRNTRRSLDRGTGRIPRELAQVADLRAHQHASILQPAELTLDRHVRQVECRSDAPGVALAIVLQEQQDLRRRMDTSCGRSYLFGAICGSTGRSGLGGWLD